MYAVRAPTSQQLVEPGEFGGAAGDDEFAASIDGEPARLAVRRELPVTFASEGRLDAVGTVVEAGVQDAAVAAACVATPVAFLLEQCDAAARVTALQLKRQGEPDDTAPDDEKIWSIQARASARAGGKSACWCRGALKACCSACTL